MMSSVCGSVFTCRVESPRDRGPNTPPLRGNKYEVVPPVKARQAFVRYSIVASIVCSVGYSVLTSTAHLQSNTLHGGLTVIIVKYISDGFNLSRETHDSTRHI